LESRRRSIIKSLVWRLSGIIVLGLITWMYTKNLEITTVVTVFFHSVNVVLYYLHERLWDKIDWGLMRKSELSDEDQEKVMERLRKLEYIE
jgi:uncharacterized membrane protein